MCTSHVVTQTIKKTYTQGLRFKIKNFIVSKRTFSSDLGIFFYCKWEEVKNPTSNSLVPLPKAPRCLSTIAFALSVQISIWWKSE